MNSHTTSQFRKLFSDLPPAVQEQARKAFAKFQNNPWHNSLRFKQVHPTEPIFSVRVSKGYRAVGKRTEHEIVWFWIGSHEDYEKLLSRQ